MHSSIVTLSTPILVHPSVDVHVLHVFTTIGCIDYRLCEILLELACLGLRRVACAHALDRDSGGASNTIAVPLVTVRHYICALANEKRDKPR